MCWLVAYSYSFFLIHYILQIFHNVKNSSGVRDVPQKCYRNIRVFLVHGI